ncbi:hypothetical protein [Aurantimonas sp. Leaf443]|nr:hypothetical protein [Aurantimonas sp. Leaf443]
MSSVYPVLHGGRTVLPADAANPLALPGDDSDEAIWRVSGA